MAQASSPVKTKITLDGQDVTDQVIEADISREFNEAISTGEVVFNNKIGQVFGVNEELAGQPFIVQRGINSPTERYEFRGETTNVEPRGDRYTVEVSDKLVQTNRRIITTSFDKDIDPEAGVISEIVKSLLDQYTDLNYNSNSIQDSGTSLTLEKFICRNSELYERLMDLAKALNWQLYYNPETDLVYFEPKGFRTSSTVLRAGDNIVDVPDWTIDKSRLANQVTISGAVQEVQETVYADGDGSQEQSVVLDFQPTSVKVFVGSGSYDPDGSPASKPSDNAGNLLQGGKSSVTTGEYDYEYDPSPDIREVFFSQDPDAEPSFVPPTGTNNIEVQYSYDLPTPLTGKRQSSIDEWGLHEKQLTKEDIQTVNDAEVYLQKYLDYYSSPFYSTETVVDGEFGLEPGVVYETVDSENDIDRELLLTELTIRYPYRGDKIQIGDAIWRTQSFEVQVWDRLKRLEEKQNKSSDLLIQVFNLGTEINYENRFFEIRKGNVAGETGVYGNPEFGVYGDTRYGNVAGAGFILGNPDFGVLGTSTLGGAQTQKEVTVKLIPGKNKFKEYIYDEDFYDSDASNGVDWDTTNNEIALEQGDTLITEPISVGIPYTQATVNLRGSYDFSAITAELTYNDGNDFIEITSSPDTISFPEDATTVYLRIEHDGNPNGAEFPLTFPITFTDTTQTFSAELSQFDELITPAIQVDLFE